MSRITLDEVEALARAALLGCGAAPGVAATMAEVTRAAEADGLANIGVAYLPVHCRHLQLGKIDGAAVPTVDRPAPGVVAVDARGGFAHPAFNAGLPLLLDAARTSGVATMAVRHSSSAAVVGWFVERIAADGLVALAFANSSALMPAWGGSRPLFGTDPIGFATPCQGRAPIVVDMAVSATARVDILTAARRGEELPVGWALDAAGKPTTDPHAALAGSNAPLGGAKGYALAFIVEILAAALTGSSLAYEAGSMLTDEGGPHDVGQLFVAFDPGPHGGDRLASRIAGLVAEIHREGDDVRLPGDRRLEHRARAAAAGVDVDDGLLELVRGFSG